jgi:hypothetical protein
MNLTTPFYCSVRASVCCVALFAMALRAQAQAPTNDECAGAIRLFNALTFTMSTGSATNAGDPAALCQTRGKGVWFKFTPCGDGQTSVKTCGSSYDTVVEVYTGNCGVLSDLVCNDDFCGLQSSVAFNATAGTEYLIFVGGFNSSSGTLHVLMGADLVIPANDTCAGAITLGNGVTQTMCTMGASGAGDPSATCGGGALGSPVWYVFNSCIGGATLTVNTFGSNFDTVLQVYSGTCQTLTSVACNDDFGGAQSQVSFQVSGGIPYYIMVGGYGGQNGTVKVMASLSSGGSPPSNDTCANALSIREGLTFTMCTMGATSTDDPPNLCGGDITDVKSGVWYSFTPCIDGNFIVSTCGSNFDTALAVFSGNCNSLIDSACNDNACGVQSSLTFAGVAGVTYKIFVAGRGNVPSGNLHLSVKTGAADPPFNDTCSNALPLTDGGTLFTCTQGATSAGDPSVVCGIPVQKGVWFKFTPCDTGTVTINTCGSDFSTVLELYTGACGALTPLVCNSNSSGCGGYSDVSFIAVTGTTYYTYVAAASESGLLHIRAFSSDTPPINDLCSGAFRLSNGQTFSQCTQRATSDPSTLTCQPSGKGVWFEFTPCSDDLVTVSTCGSNYDTVLSVLTGDCGSLTKIACNDDFCSRSSSVSFQATSGVTYRILANGYGGTPEFGTLKIVATSSAAPPLNDTCANAYGLPEGATFTICTQGAQTISDPATLCGPLISHGVWFVFTPCNNGTYSISTCGSDYDTVLGVFYGECGALTQVGCNDDNEPCGSQSSVSFLAEANTVYRVLAAGFQQNSGQLRIRAQWEGVAPTNDLCANPIVLPLGQTMSMCTQGATNAGDPQPNCGANARPGVWFSVTACANGSVTVRTMPDSAGAILAVYSGACGSLTQIDCDNEGTGVEFSATAGSTYRILAQGYTGWLSLMANMPSLTNDFCGGAIALTNGATYTMCTDAATSLSDPASICSSPVQKGVWFTYTPCTSGTVTVTTCGSDFDTNIAAYSGNCGALTLLGCNNDSVCGSQSSLTFVATANTIYRIFAGGVNPSSGSLRIRATADAPCNQDLVLQSLVVSPTSGLVNTTGSMCVTIRNGGQTTANNFTLSTWFNRWDSATCGNKGSINQLIPSLASGASMTVCYSFTFSGSAGTRKALAFVDSQCSLVESNESNNQKSASYSVFTLPDLTVSAMTITPSSGLSGAIGSLCVTIRNSGAAVANNFSLSTWFNRWTSAACGDLGSINQSIASLGAGASLTVCYSFTFSGATGTRKAIAFVDSKCTVTETSETNNQKSASYSVFELPDLTVTALSVTPASGPVGTAATLTVTVKNGGKADATNFRLDVWHNRWSSATCGLTGDANVNIPLLAKGASATFNFPVLFSGAPGTRKAIAFVDSQCAVSETSETNNQKSFSYTVSETSSTDVENSGTPTNP